MSGNLGIPPLERVMGVGRQHGWMDGRIDGWTNGWMEECMDGSRFSMTFPIQKILGRKRKPVIIISQK